MRPFTCVTALAFLVVSEAAGGEVEIGEWISTVCTKPVPPAPLREADHKLDDLIADANELFEPEGDTAKNTSNGTADSEARAASYRDDVQAYKTCLAKEAQDDVDRLTLQLEDSIERGRQRSEHQIEIELREFEILQLDAQ